MIYLDYSPNEAVTNIVKPSLTKEEVLRKARKSKSLSPSSFKDWFLCNGYLYSKSGRISEAALKGINAHEEEYKATIDFIIKGKEPKTEFCKVIKKDILNEKGRMFIEFPFYKDFDGFCSLGFVDFAFASNSGVLWVVDIKTGAFPVNPEKNYQLAMYYYLMSNSPLLKDYKVKKLVFAIFQHGELRTWTADSDFIRLSIERLKLTLDKLRSGVVNYSYGSHCNSCFNKTNCKVFFNEKDKLMEELWKSQ